MSSYITSTDVKATLVLDGTSYADADVDRAVAAANAAVEQLFGRKFAPDAEATTRYYGIGRRHVAVREIDDLTRDSAITVAVDLNGDGTFSTTLVENTDFVFEPLNAEADEIPIEQIRAFRGRLPVGPRILSVTGTFGWPAASSPPPQLAVFAEVLAVKFLARIREAPFGVVTAGADMGVAMRIGKSDPDFPTLAAGLTRGALIA